MNKEQSILQLFPALVRVYFKQLDSYLEHLQEIRIRVDKPILLYIQKEEFFLTESGEMIKDKEQAVCLKKEEIEEIMNHICRYSPYAYAAELRQGFVTVAGGHRIGVAGQTVMEGTHVKTIKNIRFLNIRISHEIIGAADAAVPYLYVNQKVVNTLIVSPPGGGKTTLLRDLVRQVSDGNAYGTGVSVGVVDERSEIAGCYMGTPQNQVGTRTDVLDGCPKIYGMMMLIRSMAPKMVAIDELGSMEDAIALKQVINCGSNVAVTVHGTSFDEIRQKPFMRQLLAEKDFKRIILLPRREQMGRIADILDEEGQTCLS